MRRKSALTFTSLLICIALLFGGCSALVENTNISDLPSLSAAAEKEPEQHTFRAALYFKNTETEKLAVETRELELSAGERRTDAIFGALMEGPSEAGFAGFGSNVSFDKAEISDGVANLFFEYTGWMSDENKFKIACAATDTALDNLNVSYASVYLNGDVVSIEGSPCGLLTKSEGNYLQLYDEYWMKYSPDYLDLSKEKSMNVALYFLDPTKKFILPEVRKITFKGNSYVEELILQLALGPSYKYYLASPVNKEKVYEGQIEVLPIDENGRITVKAPSDLFMDASQENQKLYLASLYYTVAGLVPGVKELAFDLDGEIKIASRWMSEQYVGDRITLYFPNMNLSSLETVSRTVATGESDAYETYLRELIRGPIDVDADEVWPSFPAGVEYGDLKGIKIAGSKITVDFSQNFLTQLSAMSPERKKMLVYSIVNTLTGKGEVKTVQFLIEGERVESEEGQIDLYSPLMPNPGIQ